MLTWALSIAVEMLHEDEEGKTLWYMCWEAKQVKEYVEKSEDTIRRVLLCDRTKKEANHYLHNLTPTGRSYALQEKMNNNPLTTYPS